MENLGKKFAGSDQVCCEGKWGKVTCHRSWYFRPESPQETDAGASYYNFTLDLFSMALCFLQARKFLEHSIFLALNIATYIHLHDKKSFYSFSFRSFDRGILAYMILFDGKFDHFENGGIIKQEIVQNSF